MKAIPFRASLGGLGLISATLTLAGAQDFQPRMGEPVRGLTQTELFDFENGREEFNRILTTQDGLGPIFNDSSCGQCHAAPTVGGFGNRVVTRFGKKATPGFPFDPFADLGGSLLQSSLIEGFDPDIYGDKIPAEADLIINRITPQSFGVGLIEEIPDAQILANVGSSPNVNGIVRWTTPFEGGAMTPSRFGWKGGIATVLSFSADASVMELGLTNWIFPDDQAPQGNAALLAVLDSVADPEDFQDGNGKFRIDRQSDFQRFLAAPPQSPKSGMTGEALFNQIGCADCHVSTYVTGNSQYPALANQIVQPYSDFLLHDMGHPDQGGLGDGLVDGIATETMMFTRALWGLNQRTGLLHDGRATGAGFGGNVAIAIDWHRGDANFSRQNFQALSAAQQQQVVDFLQSLGRPEFDYDSNNRIDVFDWFFLQPDFQGPGAPSVTPDDLSAVADVNQDGHLDLADFLIFQRAITD